MSGLGLLLGLRLRSARHALARRPARYLLGLVLFGLLYWGMLTATRRAVRFVDRFLRLGNEDIAEAILQRSLETLFLLLALAVAFSVLTTAIHTLFAAEDLPFLLGLPLAPAQVFGLKMFETYLSAALLPAIFTVPVLVGLGLERQASAAYYPLALAAVLALYALPVALGSLLALVLVRLAPAGRVREIATALSVVLAAGFIYALRALRPERLANLTLEELSALLGLLSSFELGYLPSSWTAQAVWGALRGEPTWGALWLAALALASLSAVGYLAAVAYRQGWIRALESATPRRDPRPRRAAAWERPLAALGQPGAIVVKDVRVVLRDPTQWSQLLVLAALAGVYLSSVGSFKLEGLESQRFRDALGAMNVLFLGFLLAGVGIRTAYPLVSLEGEGFWLLKTGPVSSAQIVMSKFWHSLAPMLLFGVGLGAVAARVIDVSPTLAWASPIAGFCAALAVTGLGVGLGAAFPRFAATSPSEVALAAGGFLYMGLSLLFSALLALLLAYPAYRALRAPGELVWGTPEGGLVLALLAALTLLWTALPLAYGSYRLARYEPGGD